MYNRRINGLPKSAELYHYGVPDQRWGTRRYQYPDGSLTPLGRIHYGYGPKVKEAAKKAVTNVGKGTVATAKGVGKVVATVSRPIRKRHPWMLTDNELAKATDRYKREKAMVDTRRNIYGDPFSKRFGAAAGEVLKGAAKIGADKFAEKFGTQLAERAFESNTARQGREYLERTTLNNNIADYFNSQRTANEARRESAREAEQYREQQRERQQAQREREQAQREREQQQRQERQQAQRQREIDREYQQQLRAQRQRQQEANRDYAREHTQRLFEQRQAAERQRQENAARRLEEAERNARMRRYGPGGTAYR